MVGNGREGRKKEKGRGGARFTEAQTIFKLLESCEKLRVCGVTICLLAGLLQFRL